MAANSDYGAGRPGEKRPTAPSGVGGKSSGSRRDGETVPNHAAPMDLPETFGRYRIVKKLGGGGMGAVYLAHDTELDREVALKVPHFSDADDPEVRERFLREARLAAKLDHPNLCPVFDVGVFDGVYYLTMRYLKGVLLSTCAGVPQPPRKVVEVVAKLAQALEAAHRSGVIHRDLKPDNVMMCGSIGPTVMDFGLAKQSRQQDRKLTQTGTAMGTPLYMPPEQVRGELDRMGPASDVYSLGVILYELLTGRLPFDGGIAEVYGKILYAELAPPSQVRPALNPKLDAICGQAMAKAPDGRFASMKAFAAALIDYLKTTPATEGAGSLIAKTAAGDAINRDQMFAAPLEAAGPMNRANIFAAQTVPPGGLLPPLTTGQTGKLPPPLPQVGPTPPSSEHNPLANVAVPSVPILPHTDQNQDPFQDVSARTGEEAGPESFDFPAISSQNGWPPEENENAEEGSGVPLGVIYGWIACGLLMLTALIGLGFLAYTVQSMKTKSGEVAEVKNDREKPKGVVVKAGEKNDADKPKGDAEPKDRGGKDSGKAGEKNDADKPKGDADTVEAPVKEKAEGVGEKPPAPPVDEPKATKAGTVVLQIPGGLAARVMAFVEVDGRREAEWPTAGRELTIPVSAGNHRVTYRAKVGGRYYRKVFDVSVPPGGEVKRILTAAKPDVGANW